MRKRIQQVLLGFSWQFPLLAGLLLSQGALAASTAVAAGPCEARAQARYRKKAVETEMESISGNLSEFELRWAKERLQSRFQLEREQCRRLAASAAESDFASW